MSRRSLRGDRARARNRMLDAGCWMRASHGRCNHRSHRWMC